MRTMMRRGFNLVGPRHRRWAPLALVVALGLTLQACVGGSMGGGMPGGMGGAQINRDGQAPSPLLAATEVVVVANEFSFQPEELRLLAGEAYNLTLDNGGAAFHDLTIEGLGYVLVADAGTRSTGGLMVEEPGSYRFICSVPGHAQAGMTGTLIVEP